MADPKVFANPGNIQIQEDTVQPVSDSSVAESNPIPNYHADAGGVLPHNIVADSNEQGAMLSERGAPRDLGNWANQHGELDALDKDKVAWDEEDTNMRGMERSKLRTVAAPTAATHHIVQAPDGAKVAFPKGTSPETMHQEMEKWWAPRIQQAQSAWASVRNAASNAAQAIGLPSDMPEWQKASDEFVRDPIGTTGDVVGAIVGGLAHGANAVIPNTPENKAMVERAHAEWEQGNHLAAATTLTPLVGDGLAKAVKQAQSRDYSGSIGTSLGVAAPFLTGARGEGELPRSVEEAYAGEERRAGARSALMSPTEIETAMKNRRLQDIKTPFDSTEGAMDTINRDLKRRIPTPAEDTAFFNKKEAEAKAAKSVTVNGSGDSAASQEAINRVQSEKEQGIKTYRVDSRSGNAVPVLGVDAPDAHANPYEHIVQVQDGAVKQIQDSGRGARPLDEAKLLKQVAPKQTVGTAEGAAHDSAFFAEAKKKLGDKASFSEVAQEAQKMKASGKSEVARGADAFNEENGRLPVKHVDSQPSTNAKQIADEYDKMVHNPHDPEVQKSYAAMKSDIDDQWDFATHKMGMNMEPWTAEGQPYKNSKEMAADVRNNHHLYFFQGGDMPVDHPLAEDAGNGLTYNDKLRAVHDLFGHATNENQFGPAGEERAWREHRQMFSPEAVPALTTETRGQNSWVNFGAHLRDAEGNIPGKGEPGAIHPADRPFAEQKAGLLPEWTHTPEGSPEDTKVAADTLAHIGSGKDYAILTAENPKNTRISDEENVTRNADMEKELRSRGYEPVPVEGHNQDVQGNTEHAMFVPGISPAEAAEVGRKYGQQAVLTTEGLHDVENNTIMKSDNNNVLTGDEARKQPYYSTVGGKPFSVPLSDAVPRTATLKDLWHDESGTYTSGQFMKFLAKNKLLSKNGQMVLGDAAEEKIVPGWAEVSRFLTPEDRAQASASVQRNVVDLVNKFNPDWVADAAKAGSAAKGWYSRATALINHMFGDEAHRFTNFVASLSPQKAVEQNFADALNFYNLWQDAGKPLGPDNEKAIRDLVERAEVGMSGQVARDQLYQNLVNDVQPTGPKVSNFAKNLKGNMDAVTKDRWMAYLFGNNERMFRWFKEGTAKPAVHLAADALIRAVGQSIGMLPAEVQETSWSFLRTVVNLTESEKISPKQAIGKVSDALIKEGASELTRLIADSPKVQSALNRLATATGDERFRADNLQNSSRFKQLLQEHKEQPSTGGGAGAINRAGAERGVKQAIKARSEISQAKKAKETAAPAPKKAPKDKATEFNPKDFSSNITPALSEKMKSALA